MGGREAAVSDSIKRLKTNKQKLLPAAATTKGGDFPLVLQRGAHLRRFRALLPISALLLLVGGSRPPGGKQPTSFLRGILSYLLKRRIVSWMAMNFGRGKRAGDGSQSDEPTRRERNKQ